MTLFPNHALASSSDPAAASPWLKQSTIKAGDTGTVLVKIGAVPKDLHCVVLAVLGDKALVEYTCPNGTTALSFVSAMTYLRYRDGVLFKRLAIRPCTYGQLLKPWLVAVIEQSGGWQGFGRRGVVPSPQEELARRFTLNWAEDVPVDAAPA